MAKTLADLTLLARRKANVENNQVVTDAELLTYIDEARKFLYDLFIGVDASYSEAPYDFTLASSGTGNVTALPADFYKMRGLVIFPDTERETPVYSVPFSERTKGRLGYTLDGNNLRVFPWQTAGQGPWRLYYTPKAPQFTGDFTVRVSRGRDLPDCVPNATLGPGHTITASVNGALPPQDGVTMVLGDRMLVLETDSQVNLVAKDFGIYVVSSLGSGASKWLLTRATDYDQATPTEVRQGALTTASAGTANKNIPYALSSFSGAVDVGAQVYSVATLGVTEDAFDEYITAKVALAIFGKRQMDPGTVPAVLQMAEQRVLSMASMRASEPEQAPIMWHSRRRRSWLDDDGIV